MASWFLLFAAFGALSASELEERGRNHLYNVEFTHAQRLFSELSKRFPEHPAGPYYEATTVWMRELVRRGGMEGATFRTGYYWSSTRKEPPAPELDRSFKNAVAESMKRSEALLQRGADHREALFFLGAAEGVLSAYHASIEHRYYRAYRAGKRAKEHHERLLELDPAYADACLLPGIFEYTVATLPRTVRFAGFFIGMRGSREKGRALVQKALERGHRTRWVAKLSFAVMTEREKEYVAALRILRELQAAFPRNPLLVMERGSVHLLRKSYRAARSVFSHALREHEAGTPNFHILRPSLIRLRLAESFLFARDYEQATKELDVALRFPGIPDPIRASIFLRRGMASDARGDRKAARWDYRRALVLDANKLTNKLARKYQKRPYP